MVGDTIDNPLEALVGGTVVAGAWVVNQVWQTQFETWQKTRALTQQLTSSFTADDLVDVPPPPAEDIGSVTEEKGTNTGTLNGARDNYTWEDYVKDEYENERTNGIQSPLGPEDPNSGGALGSVPFQKENKDPQAPLGGGFGPSPEPASRLTAGSNLVMEYKNTLGANYNPTNSSAYSTYPKFRGRKGSDKAIKFDEALFSAVLVLGEEMSWKARVQTLSGGSVTGTWEFDAGNKAPQAGDFDLYFKANDGSFDTSIFQEPFEGDRRKTYPLTQSTEPELTRPPVNDSLFGPGGFLEKGRPAWEPFPAGSNGQSGTTTGDGDLQPGDLPEERPLAPPPIPQPPFPPLAFPLNPNNSTAQPQVGTNGLLAPIAKLQKATDTTQHKVGQLLVNSGGMRGDIASVAKEVGRIEQKTANLTTNLLSRLDALDDLLDILDKFLPPQKVPAKELSMNSFCDLDEEGGPLTMSISYPEEEVNRAIISRLDDIPAWLEQHLAWKTPICNQNEKPKLEGEWVSTHWVSDGDSPNGTQHLRKLFRYRTKSTRSGKALREFWAPFTWQAGPVLVQHKGAWWGTPAVWAVDEEEGKRVLRFAGGEAGINPDLDGQWVVGGSRSPRYGMTGKMRLARQQGEYWVTSRDGASGFPEL